MYAYWPEVYIFRRTNAEGNRLLTVHAAVEHADWQIIQAPFMRGHAYTVEYKQQLCFSESHLDYRQTTIVDIYGRRVEHKDQNILQLQ